MGVTRQVIAKTVYRRMEGLKFPCQLAHGSQTAHISGFTNLKEIYQKIAECFDIKSDEILFCTLNTQKVDMGHLLGLGLAQELGLDDHIFAHIKGESREVKFTKEEKPRLTWTDNGNGTVFIKRIQENSACSKNLNIKVGDAVEMINNESLVGYIHYEVNKVMREVQDGST